MRPFLTLRQDDQDQSLDLEQQEASQLIAA
jgi:hypothetical protein